jgi:hypothetical protein
MFPAPAWRSSGLAWKTSFAIAGSPAITTVRPVLSWIVKTSP